jgi:paraquat-inducible protein B
MDYGNKVTTMSKRQLILKITSPLWFLPLIALGVCAYIGAKLQR